jgi:hypothetical protein
LFDLPTTASFLIFEAAPMSALTTDWQASQHLVSSTHGRDLDWPENVPFGRGSLSGK